MSYRLVSALVLAMLLLPLLAPFAGFVVPARAQPQVFNITSVRAVPEAPLGFYLNYTQARAVVGLTGLTLDFYISADGSAVIRTGDVRVARVTVTVDTRDVFGTLKLPDNTTLFNLLGSSTGTLFVKVTDGFRVVVASVPFDLRASRLFEALKLSRTRLAFYNNTEFGVTSATNLTIDLRPYGLGITLGTFDYNVTRLVSEEHVYRLIEFNRTRGTYESDVATWIALSSYGSYFTVNFTRLTDFPLNNPERTTTFMGVTFNYEDFILEYFAGVFRNYRNAIKVDASRQVNDRPRDFTNEVEVRFSLAWPSTRTVDIFPSVAVTGVNRNAAGVTGELNVGDAIAFTLRNFPKFMWIFWEAWVYGVTLSPRLYAVNVTYGWGFMTGATGSASFTLPVLATQYGGRVIAYTFMTANATLGPFRGAPATNTTTNAVWREAIKPHVWIWSFDNTGAISTTLPIAPGSYVLVVGRGFIAEPLRFELVRAADGVKLADLTIRGTWTGVLGNGSFAAIVQLPVETLPPTLDGTSVYVVVRGTVTETNVGRTADVPTDPGARTLTLDYDGGAAAVYINPDPRAVRVKSPFGVNGIVLGGDVFPHAAVWEPVGRRTITVEAIGLNIAQAVRAVNVTFISIDSPTPGLTYRANATLALNEPVTFGYFRKTYPVPTLPHTPSGYQVKVFNRTSEIGSSDANRARVARINATIAVIDPADGVPRKAVTLATIQDVDVIGFGWAANLAAYYDVQPIVFAVNIPLATSGVDGSLRGTVRLPLYITQPGTYRILVYQDETRVTPSIRLSSFADVSVGVLPAFTVKLITSAVKFADLPVDVWAVAYFGGSIASVGQVVSVTVDAIAKGVGRATIALTPEPLASPRAVFYGFLDLVKTFGDAVKGKEVLLSATAIGRYTAGAPLQEAYDVAVVSVPPATISDILLAITLGFEIIDNFVAQLTAISGKLDTLSTALEAAVTTIRGDIAAVRSDIAAVRSDIAGVRALLLEVNTNVGLVAQAVLTVADQNNAILARLGDIDAKLTGVSSGVAKLSTDVAGLATLIRSANLSITKVVTDQAGRVIAALSDSEDRIVGAISTNAKTLSDLITAVEGRVRADVKAVSDALATFQSGAFSKLDAIAGSVDDVKADLTRLRTDAAAMASVVAGIQTTVSRIDTNVGGLVDTAKTIATTVDSINKAVPGLATKADVSGAQSAIVGEISKAKSDLQSAVKSAEDAASTSSRNWGVINAILIFIAIAVLAYSTFVARRA